MATENTENAENGEQGEKTPVGNWDWVTGKGFIEEEGEAVEPAPVPEPAPAEPAPKPSLASPPPPSEPDPLLRALPYLVPYGVFGALTMAADSLPDQQSLIYIVKVFAVAAALWYYRKSYTEVKLSFGPAAWAAAAVGVLVIVAWVGLDKFYPQTASEATFFVERAQRVFEHADKVKGAFNPYEPTQTMPPLVAIIFRIIGAVILVPIFEELLIRSWLMRYVIKEKFWEMPMAAFTHASFWVGVGAMVMTHHEWLAAMICSAALNWVLYWKKDIWLCIVAHAAANAALAAWVLTTGQWQFW